MQNSLQQIEIGLAWCLYCEAVNYDKNKLEPVRQVLLAQDSIPDVISEHLKQVRQLGSLGFPETLDELKDYQNKYKHFWTSHIGMIYGGVTKVKQYVFTQSKLPDIRGASALLDRINLIDLPAFFGKCDKFDKSDEYNETYLKSITIGQWLAENFPGLEGLLIPQLIIYSTGGNILAFCPAKCVNDASDAIEKRYTEETLTANSCAVGEKFKLIETQFGLLPDTIDDNTFWFDKYKEYQNEEIIQSYFKQPDVESPKEAFEQRKSFNELATKLASLFNKRRSGNIITDERLTRRNPAMFETHPYLIRDEVDNASTVMLVGELPQKPKLSESLARKRLVGNIAKRHSDSKVSKDWYQHRGFNWQPGDKVFIQSWVEKFENYLKKNGLFNEYTQEPYSHNKDISEARSLIEIGNSSQPKGFVAYIYADGNNMGGYIQKIKTPQEYKQFSRDVSIATEISVYKALFKHVRPHLIKDIPDKEKEKRNGEWIHPFEIITIGGDDVFLIVPADKALAISQTLSEEFENILIAEGEKRKTTDNKNLYITSDIYDPKVIHRYQAPKEETQIAGNNQCKLSMSAGVLIAADDTPIYYAEKLTSQLMKSAKKYAKDLKKDKCDDKSNKNKYYGGTIDFLVMKSVTMISSNISEYRSQGLTKAGTENHTLKLYGSPYTLHEINGLLKTAQVLKDAEFPRSQLYQIRSFLERGKRTAMLNYCYFRVRLSDENARKLIVSQFEEAWCKPKDKGNKGNLAPWMTLKDDKEKTTYETIWRELVDLYPFIAASKTNHKQETGDRRQNVGDRK